MHAACCHQHKPHQPQHASLLTIRETRHDQRHDSPSNSSMTSHGDHKQMGVSIAAFVSAGFVTWVEVVDSSDAARRRGWGGVCMSDIPASIARVPSQLEGWGAHHVKAVPQTCKSGVCLSAPYGSSLPSCSKQVCLDKLGIPRAPKGQPLGERPAELGSILYVMIAVVVVTGLEREVAARCV